jgi:hypothetical protein
MTSSLPENTAADQIIWSHDITKGIFHKKIVATETISSYYVRLQSFDENGHQRADTKMLLSDISDILVMNAHSVSSSTYSGFSGGRYFRGYYGMGSSNSRQVGDVVFLYQGKPIIIFRQIAAPQGVANLAKAERKRILQEKKQQPITVTVPPVPPQLQDKFVTYQHNDIFKIDRPPTWALITNREVINNNNTDSKYVVVFKAAPLTCLAAFGIAIIDNITALDSYADTNLKTLFTIEKNKNFRLVESSNKAILGGERAYKIVYNGLINSVNAVHLSIFTIKNNNIYSILFNCEADNYDTYLPVVQHMIESFRFI